MSSTFGLRRLLGLALAAACVPLATCHDDRWIDIWASMPQQVEPYNLPNAPYVSSPTDLLLPPRKQVGVIATNT